MGQLNVNGSLCEFEVEFDMLLFWVLCEQLSLMGIKYGCGVV